MFHEGSLQSGIALAIQQQKLVACFVRDDSATSTTWENDWLKSGWVSSLLADKAVVLRLEAGSTEAGFLAAFCDVTNTPTLVIINNGKLQVQLKNEVGQTEFVNGIRQVLGANPIPGSSAAPTTVQPAQPAQNTPGNAPETATNDLYGDPSHHVPIRNIPSYRSASQSPANTSEAATPSAKAKGKQKATSAADQSSKSSSSATSVAQQAARDALRKKKREEAEELARVKARIEADKAERRAQAEARKAEREQEKALGQDAQNTTRTTTSTRGSQAKQVNLNVRLFDGRTIRSTFPRDANLQDDVRKWVDTEFSKLAADDPNIANHNQRLPPYFFRHILPPQPSRELSAGDESQTLGDIDLAPSATLVLQPVKGYTEAYSGNGGGVVGAATGLVGGAFGLLSSTVGFAASTLGSVIGYGTDAAQGSGSSSSQTAATAGSSQPAPQERTERNDGSSIRVRTLADQRAREPRSQQFYNGNQLSTEPRIDDDDKRS